MSTIYLIRHGQAGTRENYDQLSDLGRQQALLLGEYFLRQEISFDMAIAGNMSRQIETGRLALEAFHRAGYETPDLTIDEQWNEFSLSAVYRAMAVRLMEEDEAFARDIELMKEELAKDPHNTRGATGRCDAAVIRAWMENRYEDFEGESWAAFRARIRGCLGSIVNGPADRHIAVFTSATPIAILAGAALGLTDENLLRLLGVLYNTNLTIIRACGEDLRLFTLNAIPHLPRSMWTFR